MKKTSTLLLLLLLCAAPLMFTGCGPSEDETLAMLVDGGWDGVMDISYTLDNGMTYKSTGSHVQFWSGNNLTSGYGKWCNTFPETAPYTSLSYDFTWEAQDKVIYIHFKTDNIENADRANVKIGTYYINAGKFTGKIVSLPGIKSTFIDIIRPISPSEG